jgi:hypothetical protein
MKRRSRRQQRARIMLTSGELCALLVAVDRMRDASALQVRDLQRVRDEVAAALVRSCVPPQARSPKR